MLGHTVHAIPFVVVIMTAALRTFDIALEQAAMGLGASRLRAVWRVTLPQIRPALISAIFLAFISSFDELVIAMFLGGVEHDAAEEDVRQHPERDRPDDRGGVGAADRARDGGAGPCFRIWRRGRSIRDGSRMSRREEILAQGSLPLAEIRRRLEAEALPRNVGALLDDASQAVSDRTALHFIDTARSSPIASCGCREPAGQWPHVRGRAQGNARRGDASQHPGVADHWLAIARLGAVAVPVNTRYTARELHYALDDGAAECLVIHESHPPSSPAFRHRCRALLAASSSSGRRPASIAAGATLSDRPIPS